MAVGAAPGHDTGGSSAPAQLPLPPRAASPTGCQVRSQKHLASVTGKTFPKDRWTGGGGGCPSGKPSPGDQPSPGRLEMPGSAHLLLPDFVTLGQSHAASPEMDEWVARFFRGTPTRTQASLVREAQRGPCPGCGHVPGGGRLQR